MRIICAKITNIMVLGINTKDRNRITILLKDKGKVIDSMDEQNAYGSQVVLPLLDKILKKNNLTYKDLESLEVETGPGSFTGLKVGVSIANALGFALGIKVNGKKIETDIHY